MIIRSHEVKDDGYELMHDGKLCTIFSAPNYCDQHGNKGAWIIFDRDLKPSYVQFRESPHPDIKPMRYAGNAMGMM
jgi:serine/threonine-protein phosphatase 5